MKHDISKMIVIVIALGFAATSFVVVSNPYGHISSAGNRYNNISKGIESNSVIDKSSIALIPQRTVFTPPTYLDNVTFVETGLPSGATWYVNTTNEETCCVRQPENLSGPITGSSYTPELPNNNFEDLYCISTSDHNYKPSPSSGCFHELDKQQIIIVTFEKFTYTVKFTEKGLPGGFSWNLIFNSVEHTLTNTSYTFYAANGTYSYFASANDYNDLSGSIEVNGTSQSVNLSFVLNMYQITISESGLPKETEWFVNLSSSQSFSSSTDSVTFKEPNGTYAYTIATTDHSYRSFENSGSLTVFGAAVNVSIEFSQIQYPVTFRESGLPAGTVWYAMLSNNLTGFSLSNKLSLFTANGTYSYTIETSNNAYRPSLSTGSVTVNGSAVNVSIEFSQIQYTVTFKESGLPSGTTWGVAINGTTQSSDNNTIAFSLPEGTYSYTIETSDHAYRPCASSGSVAVNGSSETAINTKFLEVKYSVLFAETGLSSGKDWYVNITGTNGNSGNSEVITGTSYSFCLLNGTYSYSATSANYKDLSGHLTVNGTSQTVLLSFILQTYSVTFIESGLPSGTLWAVTIDGTIQSSDNNTITFSLPDGTYSYAIANLSGYNSTKSNSSINVNGKNTSENVVFSLTSSKATTTGKPSAASSFDTDLYAIIGALLAVAVIGAVFTTIFRKRK